MALPLRSLQELTLRDRPQLWFDGHRGRVQCVRAGASYTSGLTRCIRAATTAGASAMHSTTALVQRKTPLLLDRCIRPQALLKRRTPPLLDRFTPRLALPRRLPKGQASRPLQHVQENHKTCFNQKCVLRQGPGIILSPHRRRIQIPSLLNKPYSAVQPATYTHW